MSRSIPNKAVLALALATACGWGSGRGKSAELEPSEAQPFPVFSPEHAETDTAQARAALARDAWRRELRFLDAADPGFEFRSTRPNQPELEAGRFSALQWFEMGGVLFAHNFRAAEGYGGADLPTASRFHTGERGGPDARRCASCHWRGGVAGAGDAADNAFFRGDGGSEATALVRNPPSLLGAGWKQLVAEEMTRSLQRTRADYIDFAKEQRERLTAPLVTHGISFGRLTVQANGDVDTSEVQGVDADLVVRPFGWKGAFVDLRDVVEDALNVHHGMQSSFLAETAPSRRVGEGPPADPDNDGVEDEINEGQVSVLTMFVAMQDVPIDKPPAEPDLVLAYAKGRVAFESLGCADCHTPSIRIEPMDYVLASRTGGGSLAVNLTEDGGQPTLGPGFDETAIDVPLYSDLKRHDMGAELAESRADADVEPAVFLTPPLWGIARSRPYMHDGRAPTIEDAILLHGGEAQAARDAFAALSNEERGPLRIFLTSLTRREHLDSP